MSTRKVIHIADDGSEHDSAKEANRHDRIMALAEFIASEVGEVEANKTLYEDIAHALLVCYNVSKKPEPKA